MDGASVGMIGPASHRVKEMATAKEIYFWKKLRELLARMTESDSAERKSNPGFLPGTVTEAVTIPASAMDSSVLLGKLQPFEVW
jgi:hypothetical protein